MFPRLHVVTASLDVVRSAAVGPQVAVQVRVDDDVTDRHAYHLTLAVLEICRARGAMCLVNDRLDVALAAGADGAHVGADDLPVPVARTVLGRSAVLGATCRTAADGRAARDAGATYLGVGPAYPTSTKDGLPDPLGPDGVAAVAHAVPGTPVIAIGGITPERVPPAAYGVAAEGAIARDPQRATAAFLEALSQRVPS
jgi:thiamine-phosphate pyrophosphorylase